MPHTYAWLGLAVIVLFGGFICFIREPKSKVSAGEIGLGIITLITTLASPVSQEDVSKTFASTAFISQAYAQTENKIDTAGVTLDLNVDESENHHNFLIQVRDAQSDEIIGTTKTDKQMVDLENIKKKGEYYIYLEGKGHKWTKFKVDYDGKKTLLKVKPQSSSIPMLFQRFTGTKEPASLETVSVED